MALFTGLKVNLSTGQPTVELISQKDMDLFCLDERGVIEGSFGQSGKVKIRIPSGLSAETQKALASHGKKKGGKESEDAKQQGRVQVEKCITCIEMVLFAGSSSSSSPIRVILNFKRYVYDPEKKMKQS